MLTQEELQFFNEINLLDMYSVLAVNLVDSYENINIMKVAESDIKSYGLSGKSSEIAIQKYKDLEERFEEIKDNKEHKNFFSLENHIKYIVCYLEIYFQAVYTK